MTMPPAQLLPLGMAVVGFNKKDNKEGIRHLDGTSQPAERFASLSEAIQVSAKAVKAIGVDRDVDAKQKKETKQELMTLLRSQLPDDALNWIDAAVVLTENDPKYPPLLGTGGNDGRLDFTNNFLRNLVEEGVGLFDAYSGEPSQVAKQLLSNALLGTVSKDFIPKTKPIGQFSPGQAGGVNATSGTEGDSSINPWDFILMLEGAIAFAGAVTRRYQGTTESMASFPFTVSAVGAGWGGTGISDEKSARAEFWAPLWDRPAMFSEIQTVLAEGRAVLNGKTVRNGLDFSRAVKSLGISRGLSDFQRYGFYERSGKSYLSTPLGRHSVATSVSPSAKLIADFDKYGWLERVKREARGSNIPASTKNVVKRFEDALMNLLQQPQHWRPAQQVLVALGELCERLSKSPAMRDKVPPPPVLSSTWIKESNDRSPEFRIATALASIGITHEKASGSNGLPGAGQGVDDSINGEAVSVVSTIPMSCSFCPNKSQRFYLAARMV